MRVIFGNLGDDDAPNMNRFALKILAESPRVFFFTGNTVVADEGIREDKYLPAVTGVRHAFGVAGHASVENNFAVCVFLCAKGLASECSAVLENEMHHNLREKFLEDTLNGNAEGLQFLLRHLPYDLLVYTKIFMNEPIAHADHLFPRNIGMRCTQFH